MKNLVFLSASRLAEAIQKRQVSCVEVIDAHLASIAKHNTTLNALVTLNTESAFQQAKAADEMLAKGNINGPLHGVPITVKDSLETQGLRTTCSYEPLANYIPERDADVVKRFKKAGAIILGKTNTPKLTSDFQTISPLFGRTNNPWNLNYTPGGSTGGGAAAVAAGLSPLEIGSDLGGSIRVPAHFCGLFGLKPTENVISTQGHIPELPGQPKTIKHLQTIGFLARSIEDLTICLSVAANLEPTMPSAEIKPELLRSYRVAWSTGFGEIPASSETKAALLKLAAKLEEFGCCTQQVSPKNLDFQLALKTYSEILGYELSLSRELSIETEKQKKYITALNNRERIIFIMENFFSDWDVWLTPVVPIPAFPHQPSREAIEIEGKTFPYLKAIGAYTTIFNLTGNPAVVLPLTQSQSNLPIGVQVVGQRGRDLKLLAIAAQLCQITGLFKLPTRYC